MRFDYHRKFKKQFKKLPRNIQDKLNERLGIFERDEFHPLLNNHKLGGEYAGCRSINVTGDIRAIYKIKDDTAIFIEIGSHPELYG